VRKAGVRTAGLLDRNHADYIEPVACPHREVDRLVLRMTKLPGHRACKLAGLPGLRYHDLRHSAVTKMLENRTPRATVAEILGWASSTTNRMAKRYGYTRPDAQRQAFGEHRNRPAL
jgi:integrase